MDNDSAYSSVETEKLIHESKIFWSGKEFTCRALSDSIGASLDSVRSIIYKLHLKGFVAKVENRRGLLLWRKVVVTDADKIAKGPWRIHSNAELGIEESEEWKP